MDFWDDLGPLRMLDGSLLHASTFVNAKLPVSSTNVRFSLVPWYEVPRAPAGKKFSAQLGSLRPAPFAVLNARLRSAPEPSSESVSESDSVRDELVENEELDEVILHAHEAKPDREVHDRHDGMGPPSVVRRARPRKQRQPRQLRKRPLEEEEDGCDFFCLMGSFEFTGAPTGPCRHLQCGGWGTTRCCNRPYHYKCLMTHLSKTDKLVETASGNLVELDLCCPNCRAPMVRSQRRLLAF